MSLSKKGELEEQQANWQQKLQSAKKEYENAKNAIPNLKAQIHKLNQELAQAKLLQTKSLQNMSAAQTKLDKIDEKINKINRNERIEKIKELLNNISPEDRDILLSRS